MGSVRHLALLLLALAGTGIASESVPGAATSTPVALVGGTIHTVAGDNIAAGTVLFADGTILAVGADVDIPADAERVDVTGKHVYPGLIDGASVMGLEEIRSIRASRDYDKAGDMTPEVRAWTSR